MGMELLSQPSALSSEHLDTIVRVSDFVKCYKKHVAVQGVDLTVQRGEIYGLIGPDGAGKSSLMKAIAGVLTYDGGAIEVFGTLIDSERASERVKQRLGFLPQGLGLNLYPDLSVEENIDFFARLRLVPERDLAERKARLLAMTRLDKFRDRSMKNLSGGMKQKLGLICTLIHEPELAILDEPTTGVDPVSRRDFWTILAELQEERGMTILVSTAYMDEAARFHHMSFLSNGKVLVGGTPAEVQSLIPGSMVTFEATPQLEAVARLKRRYKQVETLGSKVHVFTDETDHAQAVKSLEASLGDIRPELVHMDEPELEDVFVALLLRQTRGPDVPALPANPWPAPNSGLAIEARGLIRDFGTFQSSGPCEFRGQAGRNIRPARCKRCWKNDRDQDAERHPVSVRRGGLGSRCRYAQSWRCDQGADRLYVPGLFAVSGSDRGGEYPALCRDLRARSANDEREVRMDRIDGRVERI